MECIGPIAGLVAALALAANWQGFGTTGTQAIGGGGLKLYDCAAVPTR